MAESVILPLIAISGLIADVGFCFIFYRCPHCEKLSMNTEVFQMKNRNKRIAVFAILAAIFLIGLCLCLYLLSCRDALSVGIIGGADGPTVIYVTGFVNRTKLIALLVGAVGILLGIAVWKRKRSKG